MTLTKLLLPAGICLQMLSTGMASPGELDGSFSPAFRRSVVPGSVTVTQGGGVLLGNTWEGHDRINGAPAADRLLLGADGTVVTAPLENLLEPQAGFFPWAAFPDATDWFPLEEGKWLVPAKNGGWLRLPGPGLVSEPFFTDLPGAVIRPQFLKDGELWVLRVLASGAAILEVRRSTDGVILRSFSDTSGWPGPPLKAVPAPDGGAWVLGGLGIPPVVMEPAEEQNHLLFRINADGLLDALVPVKSFNAYRTPKLHAGPAGAFRVTMGRDRSWDIFWPQPTTTVCKLEWFDAQGQPVRTLNVGVPYPAPLIWAEDAAGNVLAGGRGGILKRYLPDGTIDTTFPTIGPASWIHALADGKWLVDGTRRLLAGGQPDPSWQVPDISAAGRVSLLQPLGDGRMLAGGDFTSNIAILAADGTPDPSFVADPRIGRPLSLAVSGGAIYAVTQNIVTWANGRQSNLVKLDMSGAMDESFLLLAAHPLQMVERFTRVFSQPGGKLIAEGWYGSEVVTVSVVRMNEAGAITGSFPQPPGRYWPRILPLAGGGLVTGPAIHAADGTLVRQVGSGLPLQPICEWQGGVLFTEQTAGASSPLLRFRLWRGDRWVAGFSTPPLPADGPQPVNGITASEGGHGSLYIAAGWADGSTRLRRMFPDGSFDESFVPPVFSHRIRREGGPWKIAGDAGLEAFDPASVTRGVFPSTWAFHAQSDTLWIGGEFNRAAEQNRDGLARVEAGGAPIPGGPVKTAYDSWRIGMGLPDGPAMHDTDGDGLADGVEFILGTDPHAPSPGPSLRVEEEDAVFRYIFSREAVDSTVTVEFSEDLDEWIATDAGNSLTSSEEATGDTLLMTVAVPHEGKDKLFFRLRAQPR